MYLKFEHCREIGVAIGLHTNLFAMLCGFRFWHVLFPGMDPAHSTKGSLSLHDWNISSGIRRSGSVLKEKCFEIFAALEPSAGDKLPSGGPGSRCRIESTG